jgi:hypothetical protein
MLNELLQRTISRAKTQRKTLASNNMIVLQKKLSTLHQLKPQLLKYKTTLLITILESTSNGTRKKTGKKRPFQNR